MTTKAEIASWFSEGVQEQAKYMVVMCDTFDYEDYPVYLNNDADCLTLVSSPTAMQRVMEVYDLTLPKEPQMEEHRAMHLPTESKK